MKETFEQIYAQHYKLVLHILKEFMKYPDFSIHREELIQVGEIALWQAHEAFDETKGFKFTTFAGTSIRNEMKVYYRKLSKHGGGYFKQISTETETGREGEKVIKLVEQIGTEERTEDVIEINANHKAVKQIFSVLTPKETFILSHLYGIGVEEKTPKEIAEILHCSQQTVASFKHKAIQKLRLILQEQDLESFLLNPTIKKEIEVEPEKISKTLLNQLGKRHRIIIQHTYGIDAEKKTDQQIAIMLYLRTEDIEKARQNAIKKIAELMQVKKKGA